MVSLWLKIKTYGVGFFVSFILSGKTQGQEFAIPGSAGTQPVTELGLPDFKPNYASFTRKFVAPGQKWRSLNPGYALHPDAGFDVSGKPPGNVAELFEKRTVNSRTFVDLDDPSRIVAQTAYGSLHYNRNGQWLAIDSRLAPKGNGVFETERQVEPVGFDSRNRHSYIKGGNERFTFNDWSLYGMDGNTRVKIAEADWSRLTAGDNGLYITDLFPGVDAEMNVNRGSIKTNLIVRSWQFRKYDAYVFADRFGSPGSNFEFASNTVSDSTGEVRLKKGKVQLATIGRAVVYPESDVSGAKLMKYLFWGNELGILISYSEISGLLRSGPVIIDPLVSGAVSTFGGLYPMNSFNNSDCSADFNEGCSYSWNVNVPPRITVTGVLFDVVITTLAPCTRDKMRFKFSFGADTCGRRITWSTIGNPATPGITGGNSTVVNYYNACFTPSCSPSTTPVRISILRMCMGPAGCEPSCVQGTGPFIMSVEGRTLEFVTAAASPASSACPGNPINLTASGAYGVPPYSYNWTPGGASSKDVVVNPAATTSYSVTLTDACGESVSGGTLATVVVPPAATVTVTSATTSICEGGALSFSSQIANADNVAYQWKLNGLDITGANSGSYTTSTLKNNDEISVEVTNNSVCPLPKVLLSNVIKVAVEPVTPPKIMVSASFPGQKICLGRQAVFRAQISDAGGAPVIQWQKNGVDVGVNSTTYSDNQLANGDVITATVTSSNACAVPKSQASIPLSVTVVAPVETTVFQELCFKDVPYLWNGFQVTTSSTNAASYTTTSKATGCDSTTILSLYVSPPPVTTRRDTAACVSLSLNGSVFTETTVLHDTIRNRTGCDSLYFNTTITIFPVLTEVQNLRVKGCGILDYNSVTYTNNTTFTERFQNYLGCDSLVRNVEIEIENFDITLTADSLNAQFAGDRIKLQAQANIDGYQILYWTPEELFRSPNASLQMISGLANGQYKVVGQSPDGCLDSASVRVYLKPIPMGPFYPSAFSPNNRSLNNTWFPIKSEYLGNMEVWIYNRWGQCIYYSAEAGHEWDGTYQGRKVEAGVYPYKVRLYKRFDFAGSVTVLY